MQVEEKCQDNPYFANCKLIVKARWGPKPSPFFTEIVFGGQLLYCVFGQVLWEQVLRQVLLSLVYLGR